MEIIIIGGIDLRYKVIPFLITNYDDISVVQNSDDLAILNDKNMINFFNWCDENAVYEVNEEQIEMFLKDKVTNAIEFMMENNLIYLIKDRLIDYNNIVIYSNDDTFLKSIEFNADGYDGDILYKRLLLDHTNMESLDKDNLYIVFLNPFSPFFISYLFSCLFYSTISIRC